MMLSFVPLAEEGGCVGNNVLQIAEGGEIEALNLI